MRRFLHGRDSLYLFHLFPEKVRTKYITSSFTLSCPFSWCWCWYFHSHSSSSSSVKCMSVHFPLILHLLFSNPMSHLLSIPYSGGWSFTQHHCTPCASTVILYRIRFRLKWSSFDPSRWIHTIRNAHLSLHVRWILPRSWTDPRAAHLIPHDEESLRFHPTDNGFHPAENLLTVFLSKRVPSRREPFAPERIKVDSEDGRVCRAVPYPRIQ